MSETKTTRRLIRKLARTMSDVRLMQTEKKDDLARQAYTAMEGMIVSRLEYEIADEREVRAALIATGSNRLAKWLEENGNLGTKLSSEDWGRLVKLVSPEHVARLLDRNVISHKGAITVMLGHIANGHTDWQGLVVDIAGKPGNYDHAILLSASRGLLTHKNITPITAAVLRAQVAGHQTAYKDLAYNFLGKSDLYPAMLIHLAGLPWSWLKRGYRPPPVVDALYDLMESNHGRMQVMGHCRSLEFMLLNEADFEIFRQSLAAKKSIALPRIFRRR